MKDLYVVDTENRFGQILIFEKREDAVDWLRSATTWDEQKINNSVHWARRVATNHKHVTAFLDV